MQGLYAGRSQHFDHSSTICSNRHCMQATVSTVNPRMMMESVTYYMQPTVNATEHSCVTNPFRSQQESAVKHSMGLSEVRKSRFYTQDFVESFDWQ